MRLIEFNKYSDRIKKAIPVICIFIVTLFSHLVYPGYNVCIGDHATYIPPILKTLNPTLYGNDYFLSFSPLIYTFFDEFIVFLVNITGLKLFTVLFSISLILRFIFFSSIYKLSMYLTKDKTVSLLLILFFCLAQIKFGSLNNYLLPRSFGIVLGLLSLTLYFGQRRISSSIVLSVCLLFHVPSFIPFAAFFYLALLTDVKKKVVNINYLSLGLVPIGLFFVLFFLSDTSGLHIFSRMSEEYYKFQKLRHPDVFLLSGPGVKVISIYFFNFMLFGFAFYKVIDRLDAKHVRYLILVLLVTIALLIVTIVGGDLFRRIIIVQLQTMRAYQLLRIVSAILFVYCAYNHIKDYPSDEIMNLMLIGTTVSLILLPHFAFLFLIVTITIFFLRRLLPSFYDTSRRYWLLIGWTACFLVVLLWLFINGDLYSAKKLICIYVFMLLPTFFIRTLGFSSIMRFTLVILFFSTFTLITLNVKSFSYHPKHYNNLNFMELCDWIQRNTATDAVFITDPFTSKGEEIRMICGRSVFVTFKIIQSGGFDEKYAVGAIQRYNFVKEYMEKLKRFYPQRANSFFYDGSKPVIPLMRRWYKKKENNAEQDIRKILLKSPETETFIKNVRQRYKVDYIVSEAPLLLKFPITFKNDRYIVYKLI